MQCRGLWNSLSRFSTEYTLILCNQLGTKFCKLCGYDNNVRLEMRNVSISAPDNFSSTLGHYPLFLTAVGIKLGDVSNRGQ